MSDADLTALIARAAARPVSPVVQALGEHVRLHCGFQVEAVIAYGSCLRDVDPAESLIDLYVLTTARCGMGLLSRIGCRLAPPNVYYAEMELAGRRYRTKYAVLPLHQFSAKMRAANPYFWARFSQPSALLFAMNREPVIAALAAASRTLFAHAKGLASGAPLQIWQSGFQATYATELRPEGGNRAAELVAANAEFYESAARVLDNVLPVNPNWAMLRFTGKLWSVARLAKAAFTFRGGPDYLVWKIERHSGKKIILSDWQRKHPILAGAMLLPKLLRSGAVR